MMRDGYRHEYKYIISKASAELLKLRLKCMMTPDPYAGENGQYTIRSLYFDDLHYSAFSEKMDGLSDREKYRLRCYNYSTGLVKLERKEKHGDLTRKLSQSLTEQQVKQLQALDFGDLTVSQGALLDDFRKGIARGLRPAVLVDYDRTPFVCNAGQTRITLDENIRTKPYDADLWAANTAMVPVLEPDEVVLEVKFNDFLPGYLGLEDIPKIHLAVSKYVLCANKL